MSTLVQRKYERPWTRDEFPNLKRNPVRIIGWNAKEPNIAGLLRTAEAFRMEHVFMLRKPLSISAAVKQEHWQPHTYTLDLMGEIHRARNDGYTVVALEQCEGSVPLHLAALPERMCLVVGDEGSGVPPKALCVCDLAVEIAQYGNVGSLNVVTAASIALYEWTRQWAPGCTVQERGVVLDHHGQTSD